MPANISADSLLQKLQELGDHKILIQRDLESCHEQKRNLLNNVIDVEVAFKMFQTFVKIFKDQHVGMQKALVADFIHSVRVSRNKIYIEYYASKEVDEIEFDSLLNETADSDKAQKENGRGAKAPSASANSGHSDSQVSLTTRFRVHTGFDLVITAGIEPATPSLGN